MNLTSQPKRIKKGTEVAICNAVESVLIKENREDALGKERDAGALKSIVGISKSIVCSKPDVSSVQDGSEPSTQESLKSGRLSPVKSDCSTTELPCHLRDLFKRSTTDLTNEESKQLHSLLLELLTCFLKVLMILDEQTW
jgi:hypothetical protein